MIHPHTRLQYIDDAIGYGVFATEFIPAGTIVYAKDRLECEIDPQTFAQLDPEMQKVAEKYSYIDEQGVRIVSWDFAKYVNHCCNCNTISTGYGFEIALRDIHPGEQITDEYGIFNLESDMEVTCNQTGCRRRIMNEDFDRYYLDWDEQIKRVLPKVFDVEQPLMFIVDDPTVEALIDFIQDESCYRSVYALRLHKNIGSDDHQPRRQEARS